MIAQAKLLGHPKVSSPGAGGESNPKPVSDCSRTTSSPGAGGRYVLSDLAKLPNPIKPRRGWEVGAKPHWWGFARASSPGALTLDTLTPTDSTAASTRATIATDVRHVWHGLRHVRHTCVEVRVELLLGEAARHLGLSDETVRRRVKGGEIPARRDPRGRWIVSLPDPPAAPHAPQGAPHVATAPQPPPQPPQSAPQSATPDVEHLTVLLAEVRERCRLLEAVVAEQTQAQAELRRLLAAALSPDRQLAAHPPEAAGRAPQRVWWAFWRR